ncbi:hypothetical protein LPTSP4_00230 [Leptospira ryugenii]|uniref:DUF5777 domain-containing protein n=2 Tax=Leptospira ryugenii TaxID=1917863 RepID=A0A2P2DV78_9LEPT|nr:hypothetical protein LPTSP4_00230 [Leptospira ryugenii]
MIFMPSTEDIGEKNLVFRFNHRFGNAKSGLDDFYGLDEGANTQLALDYGLSDRWMVGLARTSQFKTWETRTKYRVFSQDSNIPFTLSLYGVIGLETSEQTYTYSYFTRSWTGNAAIDNQINKGLNTYELTDQDKTSYLSSLLISRKINETLSLQISPMYVHRNFTPTEIDNTRYGLDIGGRIKLSTRFDISFSTILSKKRDFIGSSYSQESQKTSIAGANQFTSDQINTGLSNGSISLSEVILRNIILDEPVKHKFVPFGIGFDLETGGHVFQFMVSNTRTLAQTQLLRGGDYDFMKQEFCVGFNILRQFSIGEEREKW